MLVHQRVNHVNPTILDDSATPFSGFDWKYGTPFEPLFSHHFLIQPWYIHGDMSIKFWAKHLKHSKASYFNIFHSEIQLNMMKNAIYDD